MNLFGYSLVLVTEYIVRNTFGHFLAKKFKASLISKFFAKPNLILLLGPKPGCYFLLIT